MIAKLNILPLIKGYLKQIKGNLSNFKWYTFVYCEFSESFHNFMYTVSYNDLYSFSDC